MSGLVERLAKKRMAVKLCGPYDSVRERHEKEAAFYLLVIAEELEARRARLAATDRYEFPADPIRWPREQAGEIK